MSREELSHLSTTITDLSTNPAFKASELPALRELLARPRIGQIFLIICGDFPGGPWYSLHTKAELGATKIPPGFFSKPGGLRNFNVLSRDKRSMHALIPLGWL